jgi:hypothetical protein
LGAVAVPFPHATFVMVIMRSEQRRRRRKDGSVSFHANFTFCAFINYQSHVGVATFFQQPEHHYSSELRNRVRRIIEKVRLLQVLGDIDVHLNMSHLRKSETYNNTGITTKPMIMRASMYLERGVLIICETSCGNLASRHNGLYLHKRSISS